MDRRDKINYYLDLAETVAQRGTCLRRNYGAVIVKNDEVVSTGYVGAPRGRQNCSDIGKCIRNELNIPRGERYELCRSVHAEANAIISASRSQMLGADMYLAGKDVDYVNKCAMEGTILAHKEGGTPTLVFNIPKCDEYNLGALFYILEFACGVSGYMLGVNPFDQPGVEAYKRNMFAILGKPGYEGVLEGK